MTLAFSEEAPATAADVIIISGDSSLTLKGRAYMTCRDDNKTEPVFEIRYAIHCGPFMQAEINDAVLAVGHEGFFYLFDLVKSETLLRLEMDQYFGSFRYEEAHWYVADNAGIYCLDHAGNLRWKNEALGYDGVIIEKTDATKIYGSGEWDPPGGWVEFVVEKQTGKRLE